MLHGVGTTRGHVTDVEDISNGVGRVTGTRLRKGNPVALGIFIDIGRAVIGIDLAKAEGIVRHVCWITAETRWTSIRNEVYAELLGAN